MKYMDHYKQLVGVPAYPDYKLVSKAEWNTACDLIRDKIKEAFDLWYADLRDEYILSDDMFKLIYSEAYERGHSAGYDEVANYFPDLVDFVRRAITIYEKEQEAA